MSRSNSPRRSSTKTGKASNPIAKALRQNRPSVVPNKKRYTRKGKKPVSNDTGFNHLVAQATMMTPIKISVILQHSIAIVVSVRSHIVVAVVIHLRAGNDITEVGLAGEVQDGAAPLEE